MQQYTKDYQGSLLIKTKELLDSSGISAQDLYAETGLPFHWIRSMQQGKSPDPSVNRIQYLYEYLTENKLPI